MMQIQKEIEEANKILKEIAEALDTELGTRGLIAKKWCSPNNYMIIKTFMKVSMLKML